MELCRFYETREASKELMKDNMVMCQKCMDTYDDRVRRNVCAYCGSAKNLFEQDGYMLCGTCIDNCENHDPADWI